MFLLDLRGPEFALLYLFLLVVLNLVAYFVGAHHRAAQEAQFQGQLELDAYELALLESREAAVQTAALRLHQDQVLIWEASQWRQGPGQLAATAHPLEKTVYARMQVVGSPWLVYSDSATQSVLNEMEGRLRKAGLLSSGFYPVPFLISACVPAFGFLKIMVGASRGRPVGFLMVMFVLALMICVTFLGRSRTTGAGMRARAAAREQNEGLKATALSAPANLTGRDAALAAALFGVTALGVMELTNYFRPPVSHSSYSGGDSGSSCSSGSSCGSSGCGSSCGGGGGCGGCGS